MQTKVFKSGNSLAVRIPKQLAIFDASEDVVIERRGDTLVLCAANRATLGDVVDLFARLGPSFLASGRGHEDWLALPQREPVEPFATMVQEPAATYVNKVDTHDPRGRKSRSDGGNTAAKKHKAR